MTLLQTKMAALGAPVFIIAPREVDGRVPLAIARWRHNGAEVVVEGGDTVCVVMSLTEHRAERQVRGRTSVQSPRFGSVSVADPQDVTRFTIRGRTDVVQLFVPVREIAIAASPHRDPDVRGRFHEPAPQLERCTARALAALHERGLPDPMLLSSITLQLSLHLSEPFQDQDARAIGGLAPRHLRRIEELIADRASRPVAASPTLAELAAEAGLSLSHFAREFRRTVGQTPYGYMLRLRIERARDLVARSKMSIAEIGRRTGFPSPAHFSDRFRREIGVTPTALRYALSL